MITSSEWYFSENVAKQNESVNTKYVQYTAYRSTSNRLIKPNKLEENVSFKILQYLTFASTDSVS